MTSVSVDFVGQIRSWVFPFERDDRERIRGASNKLGPEPEDCEDCELEAEADTKDGGVRESFRASGRLDRGEGGYGS